MPASWRDRSWASSCLTYPREILIPLPAGLHPTTLSVYSPQVLTGPTSVPPRHSLENSLPLTMKLLPTFSSLFLLSLVALVSAAPVRIPTLLTKSVL